MTILYCGFCAKSQHEVAKLVAGPTVHICNECAALCFEICYPDDRRHHDAAAAVDTMQRKIREMRRRLVWLSSDLNNTLADLDRHYSTLRGERERDFTAEIIGFGEAPSDDQG